MPTFAASDWTSDFAAALEGSAPARTGSVSWVFGPLVLVVDGDEELGFEATAIRIDLHEGTSRGVRSVPVRDAGRSPFVLSGSLARWRSIFGSELSIVDAVLDSRLRYVGDLPTVVRHRDLLDAVAAAGGSVETTWPEPAVAKG